MHADKIIVHWPWEDFLYPELQDVWADHIAGMQPPCDEGLPVEVEYFYTPGRTGKYDGPPERCYPAEDEELEISSAVATVPDSAVAGQEENAVFAALALDCWESWLDHTVTAPDRRNRLVNYEIFEEYIMDKARQAHRQMIHDAEESLAEARAEARRERMEDS